jgi:hypothetical protein
MVLPVPTHHEDILTEEINGQPVMGAMDNLLEWMEGVDGPVALAVGYGICGLAFIYLVGQIVRVIL